MFIDRVVIELRSGKGGDGRISFLREKNRPRGGPDGGNGGKGGSIFLRASKNINTLFNFRHSKVFSAADGENGDIKNQYGKNAMDVYIDVPVGSVIFLEENHKFVCDLNEDGKTILICKGGRGGRGNACFKNPRNKAPKIAENGLPGERKRIIIELKLLADVGIIGFPSVGKSTFISCVTNCKAEIADYNFTTLIPNLGVVSKNNQSFVLADMPGLIEGAHQGKGLGLNFLRHIERTKILIHMVDMDSERDPYNDYLVINKELEEYKMHLIDRPQIVVASKVDNDDAYKKFVAFKNKLGIDVIPISSLANYNLDLVIDKCFELLKTAVTYPIYDEEEKEKVIELNDNEEIFRIVKRSNNEYEILGERVIRTYHLINMSEDEGMFKFIQYLNKIGVDEELHKIGAKTGDTVKIEDFEFEYFE